MDGGQSYFYWLACSTLVLLIRIKHPQKRGFVFLSLFSIITYHYSKLFIYFFKLMIFSLLVEMEGGGAGQGGREGGAVNMSRL